MTIMNERKFPYIKLGSLFETIVSDKIITIDLYDKNDLQIIKFEMPGYDALDDWLLEEDVQEFKIENLISIKIKLATYEKDTVPNAENL